MRTSPEMQSVILQLGLKHGVDFSRPEAELRLDMESFDRLCIQRLSKTRISVAHYYEQGGDLIQDPDVVFYTGYKQWVPYEIQAPISGWNRYIEFNDNGEPSTLMKKGQADLASFVKVWAKNIKQQGWLSVQTPTRINKGREEEVEDLPAAVSNQPYTGIRIGGQEANLEGYALEGNELWYLSMVGHKTSLLAIWATLIGGTGAECYLFNETSKRAVKLAEFYRAGAWRRELSALPKANGHQLVMLPGISGNTLLKAAEKKGEKPKEFLILYPPDTKEPVQVFYYQKLNAITSVPLHPDWAYWLWESSMDLHGITALEAEGVEAFLCQIPKDEGLVEDISAALASKEMRSEVA